jgi:hypothetical protein
MVGFGSQQQNSKTFTDVQNWYNKEAYSRPGK